MSQIKHNWSKRMETVNSGYGSGDGYGSGYGDGAGAGYGDGYGAGSGYGDGAGAGAGAGYGDGGGAGEGAMFCTLPEGHTGPHIHCKDDFHTKEMWHNHSEDTIQQRI